MTVDLVKFTEEIRNGKLHFLCSVRHLGTQRALGIWGLGGHSKSTWALGCLRHQALDHLGHSSTWAFGYLVHSMGT